MKPSMISLFCAALLSTGSAAADPYPTCQDALNYGYNTASYYVSSIYNKASCDRALATQYEEFVFDVIPHYWAQETLTTTPAHAACLLQGSFEGWMDTIRGEYSDCASVPGFATVQRRLLGIVGGSLFNAFYTTAPSYYTVESVERSFLYDFTAWPLAGVTSDCEAQIDLRASDLPIQLVRALKATVCE